MRDSGDTTAVKSSGATSKRARRLGAGDSAKGPVPVRAATCMSPWASPSAAAPARTARMLATDPPDSFAMHRIPCCLRLSSTILHTATPIA